MAHVRFLALVAVASLGLLQACTGSESTPSAPTVLPPAVGVVVIVSASTSPTVALEGDSVSLHVVAATQSGAALDSVTSNVGLRSSTNLLDGKFLPKQVAPDSVRVEVFGRDSRGQVIRDLRYVGFQVTALPRLRGRVVLLASKAGENPGGWRVTVTFRTRVDSTTTDVNGAYALPLRSLDVSDSIPVALALKPPTGSRYFPLYSRMTTGFVRDSVGPVVWLPMTSVSMTWIAIPSTWIVLRGRFAGATLPIDFKPLFAAPPPDENHAEYWMVRSVGIYDQRYDVYMPSTSTFGYFNFSTWLDSDFPVDVAFDREHSDTTWTASDSSIVWSALRDLEDRIGETLFVPSSASTPARRRILIRIDSALTRQHNAAGLWSPNQIQPYPYNGPSQYLGGGTVVVANRGAMDAAGLIQHEFLHGFGLGHTCAYNSTMMYSNWNGATGCTGSSASAATSDDVARLEFAAELHRAMRRESTLLGLIESQDGVRVLFEGKPSLGAPASALRAVDVPIARP